MSERKKRGHLSAEQKWQVYEECQKPNAKIREILRRHEFYSSDLVRIRRTVEAGAMEALANSIPGRKLEIPVTFGHHSGNYPDA